MADNSGSISDDDIHQIAGDLRFIKNLIIMGLVCGFILGIIGVLGLM